MKFFSLFLIIMAAGFAPNAANAATTLLQISGRDFYDDATNVFLAASSGVRLVAESGEWKRDANGAIYNAKGSSALPWRVEADNPAASGKFVKTIFLVVSNAPSIAIFESVVTSNERFRIGGRESGNKRFNAEAAVDAGAHTILDWSVNLQPKAKLSGGATQMITLVFKEPQKLEYMQFFGEGRPEWGRGFRGSLLELIALDGTVSEPVHEAVAHYFRLKYGLPLDVQSTPEGRLKGSEIGISYSGQFGSILYLK